MTQGNSTVKKNIASATGKTESKPRKKKSSTPPPPPPELTKAKFTGAIIFLLLAVFAVISYFNTDGAVIAFLANLFKGLIGWGYWTAALMFLLSSVLLFAGKDKLVGYRVWAAMLLPIVFGAIAHLFFGDCMEKGFEFQTAVSEFFETGQLMESGGVFGGLIAVGMNLAFSVYGSVPILLLAFVALLIIAFKGGFKGIFKPLEKKAREPKQPKPAKEPKAEKVSKNVDEYDFQFDTDTFDDIVSEKPKKEKRKDVPESQSSAYVSPQIQRIDRSAAFADIPLGEDDESLDFNNLDFDDASASGTEKPLKAKVKKKNGRKADFESMAPVFSEPGVSHAHDEDGFRELSFDDEFSLKPITLSAEIEEPAKSKAKKIKKSQVEAEAKAVAAQISAAPQTYDGYAFPPVSLLVSESQTTVDARDEIMLNRERLEGAIRSFGIGAGVVGVTRGPSVTRYDIELERGVKLSKITNLAGDLALALGVMNVRIAPIPDRISTVGIEVPNKAVSTVYLKDVIDSPKFQNAKSKLSFALGEDIGGDCIVGNIAKLPHMLIAGTTGSGKSVCMNCLILSLLYKARPDEVRLIMIDPKMVELGIYNGIPHLFVPVVTDPKKAAGALQWSVVEMLKRYRMFSEVGVRNLAGYNKHCAENCEETLPQIVIVIDELADLMMAASKEVEESICRVAQMGRAAGMHLIIATQRPSADVITGLMKANIPSRIAFAVSSAMESRIILDQGGAEKLIGMGDMLFSPVGCRKPIRIQGAFVSDEEREEVINFIKSNSDATSQNNEIDEFMNKAAEDKGSDQGGKSGSDDEGGFSEYDEMLPHAVEVILETGSCSVSMLQRRVKLGYSRAARIVDQMEELGIVGPYEGAKPRQVLVDRSGWHDIQVELGFVKDDDMSLVAEMSEEEDMDYID